MGPLVSRWYERTAVLAVRLAASGSTLTEARRRFRSVVEEILPMANRREAALLIGAAESEFRRVRSGGKPGATFALRRLEKAANSVDRKLQAKSKAQMVSDSLRLPCVFYCVSTHQKPRCAHREMQGEILYDRNFRQKVPWYRIREIERYIRNKDLMSVQDATKGPIWLITSPYCRHMLVPMDTEEVLMGIANTVYPDGAHRSRTDAQRAKEYRDRRKRIAVRIRNIKNAP